MGGTRMSRARRRSTWATLRQPVRAGLNAIPTLTLYSERRSEFKAFLRTTQVGSDLSATREIGDRMPLRLGYTFEYGSTEAELTAPQEPVVEPPLDRRPEGRRLRPARSCRC